MSGKQFNYRKSVPRVNMQNFYLKVLRVYNGQ